MGALLKESLRWVIGYTIRPFLKHIYLRSERSTCMFGLQLRTSKNVFHPAFFYSSKIFAAYLLQRDDLRGTKLLDIGAGSGLLSLVAARKGATVTAVDINPLAIEDTTENASKNSIKITAIISNLFEHVHGRFDFILVNPPYFPKYPQTEADYAWYCGENYEYFEALFCDMPRYIHGKSKVFMILSDVCDVDCILKIAGKNKFTLRVEIEHHLLLEKNTIYQVILCT